MKLKTMRRIFYTAIVAERKLIKDLTQFSGLSVELKKVIKSNTRLLMTVKMRGLYDVFERPLDLRRVYRAKIVRFLYQNYFKFYFNPSQMLFLLVDRYSWDLNKACFILKTQLSRGALLLRAERLKLTGNEKMIDLVDKSCFLFRQKIILWEFNQLSSDDQNFMSHYRVCSFCQAEFSAYQLAREQALNRFPYVNEETIKFVTSRKRILRPILSVLIVFLFSGILVTVLPQLKLMYDLKTVKSIRYYEDAQAQVLSGIQNSIEQLKSIETYSAYDQIPLSETVIKEGTSATAATPRWLDNQYKTRITRIFANTKDIEKTKLELNKILTDMQLRPGQGNEAMEVKPNGVLFDVIVAKSEYQNFRKNLNASSSLRKIEENQFRMWDRNNTRVMLWIKREF